MPITRAPFNVNSAGWTAYTPSVTCKRVTIHETGKTATAGFLVAFPESTDGPRTLPAGDIFIFEPGHFLRPTEGVVFYLKTVSGSFNFDAEEQ